MRYLATHILSKTNGRFRESWDIVKLIFIPIAFSNFNTYCVISHQPFEVSDVLFSHNDEHIHGMGTDLFLNNLTNETRHSLTRKLAY